MAVKDDDLLAPPTEEEMSQEDLLAAPTEEEVGTGGEQALAGVEAVGRGALFGFGPQVAEAAGAATEVLGRGAGRAALAVGVSPETLAGTGVPFVSDVGLEELGFEIEQPGFGEQVRSGFEQRQERQEELFPGTAAVGELIGAVGTGGGLAAGGRALLGKGVARIAPGLVAKTQAVTVAAAAGSRGAQVARLGGQAAANAAEAAALTTLEAGTSASDVQTSTELGAAFSVAPAAVRGLFRGSKKLAKGAFASAFGIKGKAAEKFMDRAQEIRRLPDFDEVVEQTEKAVDELRINAAKTQEEVGEELLMGLTGIKQRVTDLSTEAFGVLDESNKRFSKAGIIKTIRDTGKGAPLGEAGRSVRRRLKNMADDVDELIEADKDGALTGRQVKEIIQSFDKEVGDIRAKAGGFLPPTTRVLSNARRAIDQQLKKNVPEYAEIMEEVASQTDFLDAASKKLGEFDKAVSSALKVGSPVEKQSQKLVKELAKRSNVDIERLRRAQEQANLFKGWNSSNFERKMRGMTRGLNGADKQQLQAIASISDDQFVRTVENFQISNEFEQEFLRGSRNVNMWSFLGFGLAQGNPIALAMGAASGGMIDKFGPKIAKSILSGIAEIKGAVTIPKIKKMNLPTDVTDELVDQFRRGFILQQTTGNMTIDDDAKAGTMIDLQSSRALSPLEKANALTQLQMDGEINAKVYKKMAAGSAKPEEDLPRIKFEPKSPKRSAPGLAQVAAGVRPLLAERKPVDY